MNRVLVTGATGFIGRHCAPLLLSRGYEIHEVSSRTFGSGFAGYRHRVDLLDSEQISNLIERVQPTHLLHFAWSVSPGDYWTSFDNLRWLQASIDLLQAFALQGGRRVVMAGTCAEYDWNYGHCTERVTPLLPATLYGACKNSLSTILHAFASQTGLSAAWGRIFLVYGPHEHPTRLIASVIRSLLKGEPARCTHGNQVRDFLHVEDVAGAFVSLLESDVEGALNIASGCPVSLKAIVSQIAEELNRPDLIQFGVLPVPAGDPPVLTADVGRLTKELGWVPQHGLKQGVRQTIEWWRTHPLESAPTG